MLNFSLVPGKKKTAQELGKAFSDFLAKDSECYQLGHYWQACIFTLYHAGWHSHTPRRVAEHWVKKGHLFCQKSKVHCAKVLWQSIIKNSEMTTRIHVYKLITFGHLIPRDHSRQWQKGSRSAIVKSKWWWRPCKKCNLI